MLLIAHGRGVGWNNVKPSGDRPSGDRPSSDRSSDQQDLVVPLVPSRTNTDIVFYESKLTKTVLSQSCSPRNQTRKQRNQTADPLGNPNPQDKWNIKPRKIEDSSVALSNSSPELSRGQHRLYSSRSNPDLSSHKIKKRKSENLDNCNESLNQITETSEKGEHFNSKLLNPEYSNSPVTHKREKAKMANNHPLFTSTQPYTNPSPILVMEDIPKNHLKKEKEKSQKNYDDFPDPVKRKIELLKLDERQIQENIDILWNIAVFVMPKSFPKKRKFKKIKNTLCQSCFY